MRLQNLLHKKKQHVSLEKCLLKDDPTSLLKNGPAFRGTNLCFRGCRLPNIVVHQAEPEGFPKLDPSFTYLHRRELSSNVISSASSLHNRAGDVAATVVKVIAAKAAAAATERLGVR